MAKSVYPPEMRDLTSLTNYSVKLVETRSFEVDLITHVKRSAQIGVLGKV